MNKLVALLLALSCLTSNAEVGDDKFYHFVGTFALTAASAAIYHELGVPKVPATLLGAFTAFGVGLVKESLDKTVDPGDVAANALGSSVAAGLILSFDLEGRKR